MTESNKHRIAKTRLVSWLRAMAESAGHDEYVHVPVADGEVSWRVNRAGPSWGVWEEFPVCIGDKGQLVGHVGPIWDEYHCDEPEERRFVGAVPTYQECLDMGLYPCVIFDVACQHKGALKVAFEVVVSNPVGGEKAEFLSRLQREWHVEIFQVDAGWILQQPRLPDRIEAVRWRMSV